MSIWPICPSANHPAFPDPKKDLTGLCLRFPFDVPFRPAGSFGDYDSLKIASIFSLLTFRSSRSPVNTSSVTVSS